MFHSLTVSTHAVTSGTDAVVCRTVCPNDPHHTIVVGKCELPGKSRMVLSVISHDAAQTAIGRLQKLQDVYEAELIPESGQSAYALLSTSNGNVGVVGGSDQVEELIERSKPEHYVKALNAL